MATAAKDICRSPTKKHAAVEATNEGSSLDGRNRAERSQQSMTPVLRIANSRWCYRQAIMIPSTDRFYLRFTAESQRSERRLGTGHLRRFQPSLEFQHPNKINDLSMIRIVSVDALNCRHWDFRITLLSTYILIRS